MENEVDVITAQSVPQAPSASVSEIPVTYSTPAVALEAVREDFLHWSEKLTDTSFQLSVALIAANWSVFGSLARVLENSWAKASLSLVVLGLGISLGGAKWMSEMLRHRYEYAEGDPVRWKREHAASAGRRVSWPFTDDIEFLGRFLRESKTWLPIGGGVLFLIGLARL
jgi:hypothetical protein